MAIHWLNPVTPDLSDEYWRCANTSTATVVRDNGVRIHLEHQARVLNARKVADLAIALPSSPARHRELR